MSRLYELGINKQFIEEEYKVSFDSTLEQIVSAINKVGVGVSKERIKALLDKAKADEQTAIESFNKTTEAAGYKVNIDKRKELTDWFFTTLKLPVYKMGKTGPALDEDALLSISQEPTAQFLLNRRKAHSKVKLLENLLDCVHADRIYPQYNLNKAVSGRFTSSGKDGDKLSINGWSSDIRTVIEPDSGYRIVSFDYANMELAMAAGFAKELTTLNTVVSGGDLHQEFADVLGTERKVAKTFNLGIQYGMTAYSIAKKLSMSEELAESYVEKYWTYHWKIKEFKQHIIRTARRLGHVSTISGIQRQARNCTDDQLYSTFIQGSAGDVFKKALVDVFTQVRDVFPVALMHDALVLMIPEDGFQERVDKVKEIMETTYKPFRLRVDIKFDQW